MVTFLGSIIQVYQSETVSGLKRVTSLLVNQHIAADSEIRVNVHVIGAEYSSSDPTGQSEFRSSVSINSDYFNYIYRNTGTTRVRQASSIQ